MSLPRSLAVLPLVALAAPHAQTLAPSGAQAPTPSTLGEGLERALLFPYRFQRTGPGRFTAENEAHGLVGEVSASRVTVQPIESATAHWTVEVELVGLGRRGTTSPLPEPATRARLNRIELTYSPTFSGELRNDMAGIEQLWTLAQAPGGVAADPIVLELSVAGTLSFVVDPDALGGCFVDGPGRVLAWYRSLVVRDANGVSLPAWIEETAAGLRICVDDRGAVYPVTIDPLYTGPIWTRAGDTTSEQFGTSMSAGGDVNGDGILDLVIGAETFSNAGVEEGHAQLFLGTPTGPRTTPSWTVAGSQPGAHFGHAVLVCGDVNGDGFDDVAVGAPDSRTQNNLQGRAHVYFGSASGPSPRPDWTVRGANACAFLGESLAAGDVNGDGYRDLAVGSRGGDHRGSVLVFHGGPTGPSTTADVVITSSQVQAQLGRAVAFADVNGDGFDDLIAGAPSFDVAGMSSAGGAHVHLGSPSGVSPVSAWSIVGAQASGELGRAVAGGDLNGDGFADVVVGEPYFDGPEPDEGRLLVFYGSASGPSPTPDQVREADRRDSEFGLALACIGDFDADGYGDLLVGAPAWRTGRALVYRGSAAGLGALPVWTRPAVTRGRFAATVAFAGDMNGDGFGDALIAAPLAESGSGRAYIYLGRHVP